MFESVVKECKWCNHNVVFLNNRSLPHVFETGGGYMASDFSLHVIQCSPNAWVDKLIKTRMAEKHGKIRSTNK